MQQQSSAGFRLSPQQQQLWVAEPDGPSLQSACVLSIAGPLDRARLRAAVVAAVARHEILRTTFRRLPGIAVPLQEVHEELEPAWDELPGSPTATELLDAQSGSFDFRRGPLVRVALAGEGDAHLLSITLPALCADHSALAALAKEVLDLYAGGQPAAAPLQY